MLNAQQESGSMSQVIDNIMNIFKAGEGKAFFDDNSDQGASWLKTWEDEDFRANYNNMKGHIEELYGVAPAKYIGHLGDEENKELFYDVLRAAHNTEVDPTLLYMIGMQEGHGSDWQWKENVRYGNQPPAPKFYNSDDLVDTYDDVGIDFFFVDQQNLLDQGFLKHPIHPVVPDDWRDKVDLGIDTHPVEYQRTGLYTIENEAGDSVKIGSITKKDSWRALGALAKQNQGYMKNYFNNKGYDFDSLDENNKLFWTYAAYNAGAGNANKLLNVLGPDALNGEMIKHYAEYKKVTGEGWHYFDEEAQEFFNTSDHPSVKAWKATGIDDKWVENILRVVGGKQIIDAYQPFEHDSFDGKKYDRY